MEKDSPAPENQTFSSPISQEQVEQLHEEALELNAPTFEQQAEREPDAEHREDLLQTVEFAKAIQAEGGQALVVGGYARDEALKRQGYEIKPKDIDIEVYGIEPGRIKEILEQMAPGKTKTAGESFQVYKFGRLDISIPRRDSKIAEGHRGFLVEGDPNMSVDEAMTRRDFTINALALNPLSGEIIDHHGGLKDMKEKTLRAVDPEKFGEDPLRVLRAMQFAGRFDFDIEPQTMEICRQQDLTELSRERIGDEWRKLLLKAEKPSIGLEAGMQLGVIGQLHPELGALADTPQEQEWHPEGDVWTHTKLVADAAAKIIRREGLKGDEAMVVMLGALCHDLGKPATTEFNQEKQRITSYGHEKAGLNPTKEFMDTIYVSRDIQRKVLNLVERHMFLAGNPHPTNAAVRRLANKLHPATIKELALVSEADHGGRGIEMESFPDGEALLERAEELEIKESPLKPLVMGRHLIEEGIKPGPEMGQILQKLFEAQEEGKFEDTEGGLTYFREKIKPELE